MFTDLRRHPRYFLPSGIPAIVHEARANIVDLSMKGARVQVTQPLALGAKVPFALMANGSTIRTEATVLWCQMVALALDEDESDVYLAGVVFPDELATVGAVLDKMIAADEAIAIQDSRSTERYAITIPLYASFGDRLTEVRLLDLSIRGARVGAKAALRVGTETSLRFRLDPGPSVDVVAKVVWCRPSDRKLGFEVGLSINGEEALLRAVIAQMCMRKQARVDMHSLRRKFDPVGTKRSGVLALTA